MRTWLPTLCATALAMVCVAPAFAEDLFRPVPHSRPASSFQGYIYVGRSDGAPRNRLLTSGEPARFAPAVHAYETRGAAEN